MKHSSLLQSNSVLSACNGSKDLMLWNSLNKSLLFFSKISVYFIVSVNGSWSVSYIFFKFLLRSVTCEPCEEVRLSIFFYVGHATMSIFMHASGNFYIDEGKIIIVRMSSMLPPFKIASWRWIYHAVCNFFWFTLT